MNNDKKSTGVIKIFVNNAKKRKTRKKEKRKRKFKTELRDILIGKVFQIV